MDSQDRSIIAISSSHGIMHAYLVLLPAMIPILGGELGDIATIGMLASLVTLFYGWFSLPVGFLADRVSKKMLITGSMVPLFLERMNDLLVGMDLLVAELDESYLEGYREVLAQMLTRAAETLGPREVKDRLAAQGNDGLEQLIRVNGKDIRLDHEGYSAIAKIVPRLTAGTSHSFANTLRETVLSACAAGDLPVPPVGVGLEEGGVTGFLMT